MLNLREIPDFPKPGILFYDVTTLFKNAECLQGLIDELYEMYKDKGITKVVGIESRGFILGGALAARLGAGFVMARKPGKLPAEVLEETKNTAPTPSKSTRTPSPKTMWSCFTMTFLLQGERWRQHIGWYGKAEPSRPTSTSLSN